MRKYKGLVYPTQDTVDDIHLEKFRNVTKGLLQIIIIRVNYLLVWF